MLSNFLRSQVLGRSAFCEINPIYQFIANNHASFHLLSNEDLLNHQKISKYYENDNRSTRLDLILPMTICWFWLNKKSRIQD